MLFEILINYLLFQLCRRAIINDSPYDDNETTKNSFHVLSYEKSKSFIRFDI